MEAVEVFGMACEDEVLAALAGHEIVDELGLFAEEAAIVFAFAVVVVFAGPFAAESRVEVGAFCEEFPGDGAQRDFEDAGVGFGGEGDDEAMEAVHGLDEGEERGESGGVEGGFDACAEWDEFEHRVGSCA